MKILTAANGRMSTFATHCAESVKKLGYSIVVYDLGGLGFGKSFPMDSRSFQEKGYYREITKNRYAPGEHKPAVIRDCLQSENQFLIYLDADTIVLDRIDDMIGDYDIGLTVRPQWEIEKLVKRFHPDDYFIYDGFVNSGVMCFNNTPGTYHFLANWERKIAQIHAEQGAINDMLKKHAPLEANQIIMVDGIKIRTFDTMRYNHYYFYTPEDIDVYSAIKDDLTVNWRDAKILHFKGRMRREYDRIISSL